MLATDSSRRIRRASGCAGRSGRWKKFAAPASRSPAGATTSMCTRASSSIPERHRTRSPLHLRDSACSMHTSLPASAKRSTWRTASETSCCVTCHRLRLTAAPTSVTSWETARRSTTRTCSRAHCWRGSRTMSSGQLRFVAAAAAGVRYTVGDSARTSRGPMRSPPEATGSTVSTPATCSTACSRASRWAWQTRPNRHGSGACTSTRGSCS